LLPTASAPDADAVLREQATNLFDGLVQTADHETLLLLCPLLRLLAGNLE
jgi:hypothetical protein